RHVSAARQPGFLFPLSRRADSDHRGHAQSAAFADRPGLRRDKGQRDRRQKHGRQRIALVKSFAISAAITGFAGVLFAHKLSFISPEMFTLQLSIEFIIVILIGGAFSLHGAVLGAIFLVMIDLFLTYLKDDVPGMVAAVAAA